MPFITQGKTNLKYILSFVAIILVILVVRIIFSYFFTDMPIAQAPWMLNCFLKGEHLEQMGMNRNNFACVAHYSDGGESCTDSNQCKGRCITDKPKATEGFCAHDSKEPFVCGYGELKDGKILPLICVD